MRRSRAGGSKIVAQDAGPLAEACGAPHIQPRHEPVRAGDVKHSLADLTRAREVLGYAPVVSLEQGLGETIEWYKAEYAGAGGAKL